MVGFAPAAAPALSTESTKTSKATKNATSCGERCDSGRERSVAPVTAKMFEDGRRPVIIASLEVAVLQSNRSHVVRRVALTLAMIVWAVVIGTRGAVVAEQVAETRSPVMPQYDTERKLRLPSGYRQWILVGQSLGLSYSEGQGGHQMFNTTLMEPTAYRHFVETGEFRDGTMLALILQGIGTNATPARQGQFATDVHVVEMAVKDTGRVPEGWAYLPVRRADDRWIPIDRCAAAEDQLLQLSRRACRARQCFRSVLRSLEGGHASRQVSRWVSLVAG